MYRLTGLVLLALAFAAPAAARQTPALPAVAAPVAVDAGQTAQPPRGQAFQAPAATPQPPRPAEPSEMVNVRVELAISETVGPPGPTRKTVVLLTRNASRGSVRSSLQIPGGTMALYVDARPDVLKDGRIDLSLTFVYSPDPQTSAPAGDTRPPDLTESMEVILQDGKPLQISQSADPKGDRKVAVDVTATIVK